MTLFAVDPNTGWGALADALDVQRAMKLLPKFALLSFGVAAVPLAIAGLSSARVSQEALREAIQDQEALVAANVSNHVATHVGNLLDILRAQTQVLIGQPDKPEVFEGFLHLVYHQSNDFTAVVAVDRAGKSLGSAHQPQPRPHSLLGQHDGARPEDLRRLVQDLPLKEVLEQRGGDRAGVPGRPARGRAHHPGRPLPAGAGAGAARCWRRWCRCTGCRSTWPRWRWTSATSSCWTGPAGWWPRAGPVGPPSFATRPLPRTLQGTLPERPRCSPPTSTGGGCSPPTPAFRRSCSGWWWSARSARRCRRCAGWAC